MLKESGFKIITMDIYIFKRKVIIIDYGTPNYHIYSFDLSFMIFGFGVSDFGHDMVTLDSYYQMQIHDIENRGTW